MSIDIFAEAKEKTVPAWAKFVNAGDQVQGTYVGKILGQRDGYGNEQIVYQLLQDDDSIVNVGFGLNKKVMNMDMAGVKFGQIIGFRYKGTVSVKDKFGKVVNVKDYALHQDSKIVNTEWLKANASNMPEAVTVDAVATPVNTGYDSLNGPDSKKEVEDVPFSSETSLTNEDKLKAIEKLANEKLGAFEGTWKEKVMTALGVAIIPLNYDRILEALTKFGF